MSISTSSYDVLRTYLFSEAGIVLEDNKHYLVQARLGPLSKKRGFGSIDELCGQLHNGHPDLRRDVVEALTVNETSFFRDLAPFEALRTTIFPELFRRRAASKKLSIWCAACSTGQEPYSIAMTLLETVPNLHQWNLSILATDLSTQVLERAKQGRYSQLEVNRGLPITHLVKYFQQDGTHWTLKSQVRSMVHFQTLNLKQDYFLPSAPFDIIFCRNVMIYFDVPTKTQMLHKILSLFQGDGYFFMGGAESPLFLDVDLTRYSIGRATYYQVDPK